MRDKLLGKESKDIDVAIDCLSGKDFYAALQDYAAATGTGKLGKLGEIKKDAEKSKHLETATTKLFGLELDLVNLRTETYDEVSRNPIIEMGTAEEDALRRDATINAMFYNLNTKTVEDLTGKGCDDLDAGIIRTPLDPKKTFEDDPLRILRLVRFACRFSFEIESEALHWMKDKKIQAALEKKISRERILVELQKTLQGPAPARSLQIILRQELYNTIFTVPGYPDSVVPKVSTERLEMALKASQQSDSTRAQEVLNLFSLTSTDDRWRGWLLCALLPWFGQDMPKAIIKKGAPATIVARVARDSISVDNKTLKAIQVAEQNHGVARAMASRQGIHEGKDENSDESRKRLRMDPVDFDRVEVGMTIRQWGEHWRCIGAAAALLDVTEANADTAAVLQIYGAWLQYIEREELGQVWDGKIFRLVLDGKAILKALQEEVAGLKTGPWMSEAVNVVARYQFKAGKDVSVEGATQALKQALSHGSLDVKMPASAKK